MWQIACVRKWRLCIKMLRAARFWLVFAAFLVFAVLPAAAASGGMTIRVGWDLTSGLHTYNASADLASGGNDAPGVYGGYDYEYLKRIAEFTGWKYKWLLAVFWETRTIQAIQNLSALTSGNLL